MRKIILVLGILLLIPVMVYAAGSVTVDSKDINYGQTWVSFVWRADIDNATVPSISTSASSIKKSDRWPQNYSGCIAMVEITPGIDNAPTDNYDITLTDDGSGIDIMGGELANLSNTATAQIVPKIDTVFGCRPVKGSFTFNVSGNSIENATGVANVVIYEDKR